MTTTPPADDPQARRRTADKHIASLDRRSRELEIEGRYQEAQEAVEAAASWGFWATYGVDPEHFETTHSD